jgi:hypothetical protein
MKMFRARGAIPLAFLVAARANADVYESLWKSEISQGI